MRGTLADASLARYAGRFVWLELDFDNPRNAAFLAAHDVAYTPTFFVLDPTGAHVVATQGGAMTLAELTALLERNSRSAAVATTADTALARGDGLAGSGHRVQALVAYREALRLGGQTWAERDRAVASLTWTLMLAGDSRACAETAAAEASTMTRSGMFGRVVLAGVTCINQAASYPALDATRRALDLLAAEAIDAPSTVRDHRFQLYQQLMVGAAAQHDEKAMARWGDRWIGELDATTPANDDERSALDIARVDAATLLEAPPRVLPALIASERAMPSNYNASLRLAQIQWLAKDYDATIAACDRGLAHVTGPLGRTWLLQTKAGALLDAGRRADALRVLEQALQAAQAIGSTQARKNNVAKVSRLIATVRHGAPPA